MSTFPVHHNNALTLIIHVPYHNNGVLSGKTHRQLPTNSTRTSRNEHHLIGHILEDNSRIFII